ncbi:MAG: hypothetical protein PHU25_08450 [Deltaproteobacteria bacterium]|nr:hypothetical protein [Deltaproteobacteria bacterium]
MARLKRPGQAGSSWGIGNRQCLVPFPRTEDALIAATAAHEGCILVTNDTTLAKRPKEAGIVTWSSEQFLSYLEELAQVDGDPVVGG